MAVSAVSRLAPVITPLELSTNTREVFTVTFHGLFMSFVYVYLLKCPLTVKLRKGSLTAQRHAPRQHNRRFPDQNFLTQSQHILGDW